MFDTDYKRLVALLLPTFLRVPVVYGLLRAGIRPVETLHNRFASARYEHNYRLTHNGQVCYLRAALNDTFDPVRRRFQLGTVEREGEWLYAVTEDGENIPLTKSEQDGVTVRVDGNPVPVVYGEEKLNAAQNDFVVYVPANVYDTQLTAVMSTVDKYKLISKRAHYERITN